MSDSESEKDKNLDIDLPPYRIRHNDMNLKLVKDIIRCNDYFILNRIGAFIQKIHIRKRRLR
jgi:hypothetical protein